jgi:CRISPR-associated protein (TIGR03986 family)
MSPSIHTPYHFVPLSKWVYMPDWSHLVSHDIPFSDGHSGVIEYELTNHTPLCVGDSDDHQGNLTFARSPLKQPIIPASSLKGMLRQVVEIASFGKLNALDNTRLSFRDISSAKGNYLANVIGKRQAVAGWIKYDSATRQWLFTSADFCKVKHSDIKQQLQLTVLNDSTAIAKYQICPLHKSTSATISEPKGQQGNKWAENLGKGDTHGHFVFTNKRISSGKSNEPYEFSYFFYPKNTPSNPQQVNQQVADLFSSNTSVEETIKNTKYNQVSYLQAHNNTELGMPVFALCTGTKVDFLGFAKMPRAPYKHSTHDMVNNQNKVHHSDAHFDMAELMFGTLRDNGLSLKSRLSFSDAITTMPAQKLYLSNLLVLSSPKPSFYPAYIEQKNNNEKSYNDYDSNAAISGFKRYIAKAPAELKLASNAKDNLNVAQKIELCPPQNIFTGKIVFHNLKTLELAALMWCLELKNSHHQLGHGKPMGAGVVSFNSKITTLRSHSEKVVPSTLATLFEKHMNTIHPANEADSWSESPQLQYLLAIGQMEQNADLDTSYMSIDAKEYQTAKTNFEKMPLLHGLSRSESATLHVKTVSTAFGKGRLASLIDKDNVWHKEQLQDAQKAQRDLEFQRDELKRQARDKQRKATLTPHELNIAELSELLPMLDASECPPKIRETVHFFLENVDKNEQQAARQLYQLAREYNYHKTPKKRVVEQKVELAKLCNGYGLTL